MKFHWFRNSPAQGRMSLMLVCLLAMAALAACVAAPPAAPEAAPAEEMAPTM